MSNLSNDQREFLDKIDRLIGCKVYSVGTSTNGHHTSKIVRASPVKTGEVFLSPKRLSAV